MVNEEYDALETITWVASVEGPFLNQLDQNIYFS